MKILKNKMIGLSTAVGLSCLSMLATAEAKTLDMLLLYTPEATTTWEGRDINARINSFVEYFNRTLKNSDAGFDARIVHIQQVDWAGDLNRATNQSLSQVSYDQRINQLRDKYGADIVSVVYKNPPGESCGIGWISSGANDGSFYRNSARGDHGYNLSAVNCYIYIVAHETGHNMGLRHSLPQDNESGYNPYYHSLGAFTFSRGWGENNSFHTPMAYPSAYGTWNVQPIFSNPRKYICEGRACGSSNVADASRALSEMSDQLVSFRPTKVSNTTNTTTVNPPVNIQQKIDFTYDFARSMSGWNSFYSSLNYAYDHRNRANQILEVKNTGYYWTGTIGDVKEHIKAGENFQLSFDTWISSATPLYAYLYIVNTSGQYQWIPVSTQSVPGWRWTTLQGVVNIPNQNIKYAELYMYSPAHKGFFIDNVRIKQL
ncbi:carbohydrate binding domain-containing protein [Zooshikella marina]|uniref:zinc-dependent metalloprotease family protein n=1 Tax=Zooshikella ganghwensis TaxID=202772 RepID=UPI001BAE7D54|nr:zinc-dependent metalloprotease family protein [Zooshikella ganghwensis]MBU2707204.1 carbohydrate binding domain-containing protein [Zooshikella ganghwensis]